MKNEKTSEAARIIRFDDLDIDDQGPTWIQIRVPAFEIPEAVFEGLDNCGLTPSQVSEVVDNIIELTTVNFLRSKIKQ